jgi:fructokinase
MDKFVLVGIGEILWDELPGSRKLGGAPANFAIHGSRLGGRGVILSGVGTASRGEEIRRVLARENIESYLLSDLYHSTGRVTVVLDEKGSASYKIHEDVAWDYLSFDPVFQKVAERADAVCFGTLAQRNGLTRSTIQTFVRATKKNCLRIFDVNLRSDYYTPRLIKELLLLADVFKCNKKEFELISDLFLSGGDETARLVELQSLFSLRLIILTKGSDGSLLFAGVGNESWHGAEPYPIVDTVGAGDSFTATVALGLLKGVELKVLHQVASRVAGYVCSRSGATPNLPKSLLRRLSVF